MNDKRIMKFYISFLVILAICIVAYTGLGPENVRIIKGVNDIRTGIDIRGGISAILEPEYPEGTEGRDIDADLSVSKDIIEKRLDAKGIYDKSINIDYTNKRLVIDIPWAANETEFNPREAIKELGSVGRLTFQEVDYDNGGYYKKPDEIKPSGRIVITGEDVKTAQAVYADGKHMVILQLKPSGVEAFSKATRDNLGKQIAIFIDEECISAPVVDEYITSNEATITGSFTFEEAKDLADKIRFGALPAKLVPVKVDAISAQLGQGALEVAIKAGIISFILVCAYMILYYRLPGIVASVALSGLIALQILVLSNFNISVTLPGIGGIILSIGMSIDGNIVIFERIKEELRGGKTLRSAIDTGFKRAFVAILDSNVTTIITAIILYALGSSSVKGFGVTLFFGTLFSFFSAITASKMMLQGISAFGFARNNKWLFGVKETAPDENAEAKDRKRYDFVKNRRYAFAFSLLLFVFFGIMLAIKGATLDVYFKGGSRLMIETVEEVDPNRAADLIRAETGREVNASVMETYGGENEKIRMLRLDITGDEPLTEEEEAKVKEVLAANFKVILNSPNNENVNITPSVGTEALIMSVLAVGLSALLIMLYVTWRFSILSGFSAAVCAILALLHDVGVMFGVYIAFGLPLNDIFIAAVLTIIGYSINDTVIIYDRIRENARMMQKADLGSIVNLSIHQSISRSINNMITTLICIVVLLIFSVTSNINSLINFSFSLLIGTVTGVYSTVFIASPLWLMWKERKQRKMLKQA